MLYEDQRNQDRKSDIILKKLKSGDFFGELPFFIENPFEETARSRTFSTVYKILRSEFIEMLSTYPSDYVYVISIDFVFYEKFNCF